MSVGALLVGAAAVSTKVSLADREPSRTVTVIVAVPLWPAAGVTVTVRLASLPPNTMLASGTRVVFDEPPSRVRLASAVSTSPTVMARAPVFAFSAIVWLAMSEIVGASLTAVTPMVKAFST